MLETHWDTPKMKMIEESHLKDFSVLLCSLKRSYLWPLDFCYIPEVHQERDEKRIFYPKKAMNILGIACNKNGQWEARKRSTDR